MLHVIGVSIRFCLLSFIFSASCSSSCLSPNYPHLRLRRWRHCLPSPSGSPLTFLSIFFLPSCSLSTLEKEIPFFLFFLFFVTCSSSSANHTALPSASARSRFFCSLADSDVLSCNFFFSFLLPVNGSLGSARNFCLSVFSHKNIFLTTLPFSFSFLFFLPRFFSSSFPLFPDPFPSFPFRLPSPSLSNFIFFLLVLLP